MGRVSRIAALLFGTVLVTNRFASSLAEPITVPNLLAPVTAACAWDDIQYMRSLWKHQQAIHDLAMNELKWELSQQLDVSVLHQFDLSNKDMQTKLEALSKEFQHLLSSKNVLKTKAEVIQLIVTHQQLESELQTLQAFLASTVDPYNIQQQQSNKEMWSAIGFLGISLDEASRALNELVNSSSAPRTPRTKECDSVLKISKSKLDESLGDLGTERDRERVILNSRFASKHVVKNLQMRTDEITKATRIVWEKVINTADAPEYMERNTVAKLKQTIQTQRSELHHLKRNLRQNQVAQNNAYKRKYQEYQSSIRRLLQQMDSVMNAWTAARSSSTNNPVVPTEVSTVEEKEESKILEDASIDPIVLQQAKVVSQNNNNSDLAWKDLVESGQEKLTHFLHLCAPFHTLGAEVERVQEQVASDLAADLPAKEEQRKKLKDLLGQISGFAHDLVLDEEAVQAMYFNRAMYSLNHPLWMFSKRKSANFAKLTHEMMEFKVHVLEVKQMRMSELLSEVKQVYGPFSSMYLGELLLAPGRATTTLLSNLFDTTGSDIILLSFVFIPIISFMLFSATVLLFPFMCVLGTVHMGYVATTAVNVALLYHPSLIQLLTTLSPTLSVMYYLTKWLFLLPLKARLLAPSVLQEQLVKDKTIRTPLKQQNLDKGGRPNKQQLQAMLQTPTKGVEVRSGKRGKKLSTADRMAAKVA